MTEISEVTFFNNSNKLTFKTKDSSYTLQFIVNTTFPNSEGINYSLTIKVVDMGTMRTYIKIVFNDKNLSNNIKIAFELGIVSINVTFSFFKFMFNYEDVTIDSSNKIINNIILQVDSKEFNELTRNSFLINKIYKEHEKLINNLIDDQIIKLYNRDIYKKYMNEIDKLIKEKNELYNESFLRRIEDTKDKIKEKFKFLEK